MGWTAPATLRADLYTVVVTTEDPASQTTRTWTVKVPGDRLNVLLPSLPAALADNALVLAVTYLRHRRAEPPRPAMADDDWPTVVVQLPIYNERHVIERMMDKLKDHRMFQGDAARRLEMCEDCRVKDMFDDQ